MSRAYKAVPFLRELMFVILWSKASIVCLIQHSDVLTVWFRNNREKMTKVIGHAMRNMSFARQRYDSTQRPVGRTVLNFEAIIMTAITIVSVRRTQTETRAAAIFLAFITEERIVTLGMMADAGDETIQIVRYGDSEDKETAMTRPRTRRRRRRRRTTTTATTTTT